MRNAQYWIKHLNLIRHPEGGYFKEVYRSKENISDNCLPQRFSSERAFSTSIYYLLEKGDFSAFHKIKSDELWHFYDGDPISIYVIDEDCNLTTYKLGLSPENDILPQVSIFANQWFASESMGEYSLVGCTVSPGFDFSDFEIADRDTLKNSYSKHAKIIEKFTHSN
jgi:uncharacterized protein